MLRTKTLLTSAASAAILGFATVPSVAMAELPASVRAMIDAAIEAQPQAADDVRGGKDAAIGRLVGAVMKASGGQADAKEVRDRLFARLRG